MTDPGPQKALFIKDIVIDCLDVEGQVAFWSALLDRPIVARIGPYVLLQRHGGIGLGFQQVTDASWDSDRKNRLHLDLGSANPADDQRVVERLGGRRLAGYEAAGFLVMADPEGNEFCIIPEGSFDVDDDGRASYLLP